MWQPASWQDLEALIGVAVESPSLEFKQRVASNTRELAKDIAAMTVDGGVLIYGISERASGAVADQIVKVPIAQTEERIRQVANSLIRPAPAFRTLPLTEHPGDADGVWVVTVPPSPLAPHEVDGRFPRRDGTTTAWMTEPEIDRLYRLRRHVVHQPLVASDLLDLALEVPGVTDTNYRTTFGDGVGGVRMACRVNGDVRHPDDPRLDLPLAAAARDAGLAAGQLLSSRPWLLDHLDRSSWIPQGTSGWAVGASVLDAPRMREELTGAGALAYPAHVLLQFSVPLSRADDGTREPLGYLCANETIVVRELLAATLLFGAFLGGFREVGRVEVAVQLFGFAEAVAYQYTRARRGMDAQRYRTAPGHLINTTESSPIELFQAPGDVVRRLVDRWLVAFVSDDIVAQALR